MPFKSRPFSTKPRNLSRNISPRKRKLSASESQDKYQTYRHIPSVSDIIQVRRLFLQCTPLPTELVDIVLDHASYWASATFASAIPVDVKGFTWSGEDIVILRTSPLGLYQDEDVADDSCQLYSSAAAAVQQVPSWLPPRGESSFRQVEFYIESHDQGWGGEYKPGWGPYDGSYTWFDAYIEHPMVRQLNGSFLPIASEGAIPSEGFKWRNAYHTIEMPASEPTSKNIFFSCPDYPTKQPLWPSAGEATHLARNRRADGKTQQHCIVWHYLDGYGSGPQFDDKDGATSDLVKRLKTGDTIAVWARARYPGWMNHIKSVSIIVSWAV